MVLLSLMLAASSPTATPSGSAPAGDPTTEHPSNEDEDEGERRTVVVTGTRTERTQAEAPIATQVYDREEIEASGAENLAEVLEETPGMQVSRGIGGVGVRMQGLDPIYTAVLIDGQRTNGRVNGVLDLSRFPAEQIEQIEVVRGPSSVLYGADTLAGAINLISRKPRKDHEAEAHVAYGSFGTVDLTGRIGLRRNRYTGSVSGGFHRTDGWEAAPSDPEDESTIGPRSSQFNVATRHELQSKGPLTLAARGSYLRRESLIIDDMGIAGTFDRRNLSEVIQTTLSPTLEGDASRLSLWASYNLFRDQFLLDQRGSSELDQYQDTYDHLGQLTAQYDHELGNHVFSAGADTQVEQLATQRIEPPAVSRQRYAIFVQDEWTPTRSPKLVVLPGFRLDYDTYFGVYPTPRIALMSVVDERWTFRASYGRGYRAPSFREMFLLFSNPSVGYTVQGNPDLRAETSWSTSVSAEFRPWSWVWLSANVFDNRLQDTIVTDTTDASDVGTATLFEYVNIGEATTRGVEGQAKITVLRQLTLDGSYTFVHSLDHTSGRPLPGRPRHSGTAGIRYRHPTSGTSLRVRSSIIGVRRFYSDTDGDDVEEAIDSLPFATVDLRASQQMFRYVQLFAGIENLLDAGNATDNPLQPRTYFGGVTLRY